MTVSPAGMATPAELDRLGRVAQHRHLGRAGVAKQPERPMQLIDARDQARWFLERALHGWGGTFNAGGPGHNTSMGRLLGDCVEATGSGAELVWVDEDFLLEHGIEPWTELPLWAPEKPEFGAVWDADSSAAVRAGLQCHPVTKSVGDTWGMASRRRLHTALNSSGHA